MPTRHLAPAAWSTTLHGVRLDAEPVRPDVHAQLVHDWMNRPHVAPWWQLDCTLAEVRDYLAGLDHLQPWIVAADGVPFGYVETYRVLDDPLAAYYPARPDDVGWHVLVGLERLLGSGLPRLMGHAVLWYLLRYGDRVVCEPDVRNTRMHAYCRRLGYQSLGEIELPDKRALLMACTRQTAQPVEALSVGSDSPSAFIRWPNTSSARSLASSSASTVPDRQLRQTDRDRYV